MTGEQGLLVARVGLVFNSGLALLLAGVLLLSIPVAILEGEDLGPMVLAALWGAVVGALGGVGLALAATLDRPVSRLAGRGLVFVQVVLMFCFCGVLPLFGTVAVWLGLLVSDREGG